MPGTGVNQRSFQESFFIRGCGNHAFISFAKPAVPVAGDDVVDKITYEPGDDDESVREFPAAIQVAGQPQDGGRFCIQFTLVDQDDGFHDSRTG